MDQGQGGGKKCRACGWLGSTVEEYKEHLFDAHSKEDLVAALVHSQAEEVGVGNGSEDSGTVERRRTRSQNTRNKTAGTSSNIDVGSDRHDSSDEYSSPSRELTNSTRSHRKSPRKASSSELTVLKSESIPSTSSSGRGSIQTAAFSSRNDEEEPAVYDMIPLGTFSVPFPLDAGGSTEEGSVTILLEDSQHSEENPNSTQCIVPPDQQDCQEILIEYPETSVDSAFSVGKINSMDKGIVQEESDNATSQTSIIKYIIDQRGKTQERIQTENEDDRWILPDGGAIPVYSSFTTQVHVISNNQRQHVAHSSRSVHGEDSTGVTISMSGPVNLMTDEELPPRGEISEYEESNTSSFISEDSKTALSGDLKKVPGKGECQRQRKDLKRRGQTTHKELDIKQQFLCAECPNNPKFKSLFELIGHKVKVHPSLKSQLVGRKFDVRASSAATVTSSASQDTIPSISENEKEDEVDEKEDIKPKTPKEFFCVYCNGTFTNKVALAGHMETDHANKPLHPNIYECNTCGKIFPARTNLRKHLLVHKERKHVCTTCSKGFTSNFKLMEHMRVHTKDYPYPCPICYKPYRTPSLLNHHHKTVHLPESERPTKPKPEFYCGTCHKILRSKRSFMEHAKTHLATPKKCPYCCETFCRQSVLIRHIRVTHDPQYETNESKDCVVCGKKLHPNSMIKHMRIHTNEKPHACQVCGRRYRTHANLASHAWSHTNQEKPFKCKICPKSYLFKRTLEHHMMVHKRRSLHYVCNECGVRFTNKVNMKRHLEEHYSEKKYKCRTCGKAFQRNYYLLEHERIHTGVKPFSCTICGKASTTKSNHRAHLKIHDAREASSQEG